MSFELEDLVENMHSALKFFLAHLNHLQDHQWDFKPYPACRSIREILLHMSETYPDNQELVAALQEPMPEIGRVQALFETAALRDFEALRHRYATTPLDAEISVVGGDWFTGRDCVKAGRLLARRSYEECYHTGQITFIRLATDPDWNQEKEVYGLMSLGASGTLA